MNTYRSIVECLASHAVNQPDKLCLADTKTHLSYKETWARVYGLASALSQLGIRKGDCVLVECTQDTDYMICEFAIQLSGGIFVPIEKNAAAARVKDILEDVDGKLYIGKASVSDAVPFMPIQTVAEHRCQKTPDLKTVRFPEKEEAAEILFSTGTTGKSKGIELSHENDVAVAENVMYGVQMKPDNVELVPMPLSHSHGLRTCYGNFLNGSSVVLINGVTLLKKVFSLMDEYRVTSLDLSPSNLSIIFKLSKDRLGDYAQQLDYIQLGSAPLSEEDKVHLSRLLPKTRLYNFYGSTEAGRSCLLDFNSMSGKPGCIGKPAKNAQFIIVDENRNPIDASLENPGFLASSGPINMKGYWKAPALTAQTMQDGFIYTKDMGYIDEEGFIYMLGRKDDVINYGGIKIAPEEIESVVLQHPQVTDCACVPMKDPLTGQAPKLFVAVQDPQTYDQKALKNYLSKQLDSNKQPKVIQVIDAIPRTFNGKIQRKKLVEMEK
ncbi:acyl--CoA ligase [bacterium 210820-DFI.6.37]|nr:acyl--CoA ligase [bacterium 210820-DFI.6.37]